jgi:ubiquinone/menaquinone biosynthesis C-methylase UbiE
VEQAKARVRAAGYGNVAFQVADLFNLPFDEGSFDHVFICFAMVEGVRQQALSLGLIDEQVFDKGIADMYRATAPGGTFCYTFFKGIGTK